MNYLKPTEQLQVLLMQDSSISCFMDFQPLKIGVSYENTTDLLVLKVLMNRMSVSPDSYLIVRDFACRTGVLGYIKLHTTMFFTQDDVDLAVFITDQDVSKKDDRFATVIKSIQKVDPVLVLSSVVALCNPHIEKWLVADHNTVKRVFGLPSDQPIPSSDTPKGIIEKARGLQTVQLSKHDSYENLANELDFAVVRKACPDFHAFCTQIKEKSNGHFDVRNDV
jgi:hypothetical protein